MTPLQAGVHLFARYAYPPNELGYCGATDHRMLLEYGAAGVTDPGLTDLARSFHGAWPYLELIAGAAGLDDPLDRRVVEAYWVGNRLLERIDVPTFARSLEDRFRKRAGSAWEHLAAAVPVGGLPHHSFHVFCVYPWVGLLPDEEDGGHPLHVLDRCRIRWGQVVEVLGSETVVRTQLLTWDGHRLAFGPPQAETARCSTDGLAFVTGLQPGDWVGLHWDWVCDRLDARQLRGLQAYSKRMLQLTNERLTRPGPAMVMS